LHPETDPIHNITTIVEKKTKKKATPSPIAGEGVAFFLVFFLAYATLIHMRNTYTYTTYRLAKNM
jgi:hypothetical protein